MRFTFLRKPFPRTVHATYHQATNLPNLEEMRRLMLDYRKRKVDVSYQKSSSLPLTVMQDAMDIL